MQWQTLYNLVELLLLSVFSTIQVMLLLSFEKMKGVRMLLLLNCHFLWLRRKYVCFFLKRQSGNDGVSPCSFCCVTNILVLQIS